MCDNVMAHAHTRTPSHTQTHNRQRAECNTHTNTTYHVQHNIHKHTRNPYACHTCTKHDKRTSETPFKWFIHFSVANSWQSSLEPHTNTCPQKNIFHPQLVVKFNLYDGRDRAPRLNTLSGRVKSLLYYYFFFVYLNKKKKQILVCIDKRQSNLTNRTRKAVQCIGNKNRTGCRSNEILGNIVLSAVTCE